MTPFLELILVLVVIVLGAKLSGFLVSKIGQPMVVGEIAFGLLLGPTVFNILHLPLFQHAETTAEVIHLLAELGVLLLMFLAGLETDLVSMRKVGLPALSSAIGGVILPFLGGWGLGTIANMPQQEAIFIGVILTATSVSISAQTLIELGKLKTKEGMCILGAAVIDDVLGILIVSVVVALFSSGGATVPIWLVAVKMTGFFVIAYLLGPLVRRIFTMFSQLPISEPLLAAALILAMLYGWSAEFFGGVAAITGSYLLGIILGQLTDKHELEEKVKVLVYSLLVPIFFVDIGLRANLRDALSGSLLWIGLAIVGIAIIAKLVGSGLGALVAGFSMKESLRVGAGMISRGEVGLIIAGIGVQRGVIPNDVFSIMVLMVVVTTLVTPVILRQMFVSDKILKI